MGAVRIAILAAAAVAAILLAFIVRGMMTGVEAPIQAAGPKASPMAQVLVAREDLPVGARIKPTMIGWQAWPVDPLSPSFITDGASAPGPTVPTPANPEGGSDPTSAPAATSAEGPVDLGANPIQALDGAIVREAIMAGEPVLARKVILGGEGGYLSVVLAPGMRAISVPVSADTAAGGFILPGDRVDALQSRGSEDGGGGRTTETLMRNLRVLAVDQNTEPARRNNTMLGAVITLEAPAADVDVLVRAKAEGEIILVLRPYTETGGPVGRGVSAEPQTVRIFRDGQVAEVSVR